MMFLFLKAYMYLSGTSVRPDDVVVFLFFWFFFLIAINDSRDTLY